MNYKEALEFAIEVTQKRVEELDALATELCGEIASSDDREEWAAIRSAHGGMVEALDMMQQCYAMAVSFDGDPGDTRGRWIEMAVSCINRGVELMTPEQCGKWEGVRGVLELAPIASPKTKLMDRPRKSSKSRRAPQGDSMQRMVSRLTAYEGESVVVEWVDEDHDWPTFRVVEVEPARQRVWLTGEDDLEGNHHEGDTFWVAVADIARVNRRPTNDPSSATRP